MDTGTWDDIRSKLNFARAGKPMLIGMATILVLVAAVAVNVLSGAATASQIEVRSASADSAQAGQGDEGAHQESLFVHVSGAVANPGLYELRPGARVADAVQAAGGFAETADTTSCNLARKLQDGEQIIVASAATAEAQQGGTAPTATTGGLVNINTASADQLQQLPGIGTSTAQKIVAERLANGPFQSVDDLTRVSGIGEKKLAALRELICV